MRISLMQISPILSFLRLTFKEHMKGIKNNFKVASFDLTLLLLLS